ncbi:MAG: hypothetical protein RSE57_02680 [Clostridia bacterium]
MNRLTIEDAAKLSGMSKQFIRIGLQRNILTFGVAEKLPKSSKYTYYINAYQFYLYIGRNDLVDKIQGGE